MTILAALSHRFLSILSEIHFPVSSSSSSSDRPARLLIADDNQQNRELLEAYLVDEGYEIAMATDGKETLDQVQKSLEAYLETKRQGFPRSLKILGRNLFRTRCKVTPGCYFVVYSTRHPDRVIFVLLVGLP